MKKLLVLVVVTFSLVIILSSCNTEENYIYWTDKTENQIQRLDHSNIKYEIREGEIWVREKDMDKVLACCT
ncbi:hypothetical protein H1D32_22615 [Anaerobacillus sp. CMMVII]|uniref:hypothetical protein n=1 Tax=Anaerobacillus sp. CMMVII TaxID=2755588 RepID=UPI0021B70B18|nr:hypothetical protein [Anaerobacillus sp. CMMVII]MCT8140244.1 hypothetical protein [Anaerobacillus sp. CMMVII]